MPFNAERFQPGFQCGLLLQYGWSGKDLKFGVVTRTTPTLIIVSDGHTTYRFHKKNGWPVGGSRFDRGAELKTMEEAIALKTELLLERRKRLLEKLVKEVKVLFGKDCNVIEELRRAANDLEVEGGRPATADADAP